MTDIPDGEWLCWPCRQFEERQRQAGVPQQQIRPPRCGAWLCCGLPGGLPGRKGAMLQAEWSLSFGLAPGLI